MFSQIKNFFLFLFLFFFDIKVINGLCMTDKGEMRWVCTKLYSHVTVIYLLYVLFVFFFLIFLFVSYGWVVVVCLCFFIEKHIVSNLRMSSLSLSLSLSQDRIGIFRSLVSHSLPTYLKCHTLRWFGGQRIKKFDEN